MAHITDFRSKIQELEYLHSKIENERKALESRMTQSKEYKRVFYDVKAQ